MLIVNCLINIKKRGFNNYCRCICDKKVPFKGEGKRKKEMFFTTNISTNANLSQVSWEYKCYLG